MKTHGTQRLFLSLALTCILGGFVSIPFAVHAEEQKDLPNFDGMGVLYDIRADGVIINDIYYRLAPEAEFKSPDATEFAQTSFQRGDTVGFFKDEKGRIIELWRLQKPI